MLRFIILLTLFTQSLIAQVEFHPVGIPWMIPADQFNPDYSSLRLDLAYNFGKYIGIKQNYGEVDLLYFPTKFGQFQPFVDFRGYIPRRTTWGGSLGMGARLLTNRNLNAWGANFYYDFLEGHRGAFNRWGAGLEYLGLCWDFRINGYFPIGSMRHHSREHVFNDYIGPFCATCRETEFDYGGFDAEVGYQFGGWNCISLYGAGGVYYYRNCDIDSFFGGMVRASAAWSTYVSLEARASYDHVYKGNVQGRVVLSIPLEELFSCRFWHYTACTDLSKRPVERLGLIFTKEACCWTWNWDDTIKNKKF